MERIFYVAGIDRPKYADYWAHQKYWLISVAFVGSNRTGIKPWMLPYLKTQKILFDPGVFSKNFSITLERYVEFIREYALPYGHEYLQLDVIGDAEATHENLVKMRELGLNPVPVLQIGGNKEILKEKRSAVGGLLSLGKNERKEYLKGLFEDPDEYGSIHLLGVTDFELIQHTNAYSMDSTSWIPRRGPKRARDFRGDYGEKFVTIARYGQLTLF